ncbi:uncharacterized [Tachysurus ichikawai]
MLPSNLADCQEFSSLLFSLPALILAKHSLRLDKWCHPDQHRDTREAIWAQAGTLDLSWERASLSAWMT